MQIMECIEWFDVYDRKGNKTLKKKTKGSKLMGNEYMLGVNVWIINPSLEFLIQKRAKNLKHSPGKLAPVGGSAIAGESPEEAAVREVKEELGINIRKEELKRIKIFKFKRIIVYAFIVLEDFNLKDVILQESEVESVELLTEKKIEDSMKAGEFFDIKQSWCEVKTYIKELSCLI
jgi:8-oxo-dGTP pyrophosphatase MutT (NUDIX family)